MYVSVEVAGTRKHAARTRRREPRRAPRATVHVEVKASCSGLLFMGCPHPPPVASAPVGLPPQRRAARGLRVVRQHALAQCRTTHVHAHSAPQPTTILPIPNLDRPTATRRSRPRLTQLSQRQAPLWFYSHCADVDQRRVDLCGRFWRRHQRYPNEQVCRCRWRVCKRSHRPNAQVLPSGRRQVARRRARHHRRRDLVLRFRPGADMRLATNHGRFKAVWQKDAQQPKELSVDFPKTDRRRVESGSLATDVSASANRSTPELRAPGGVRVPSD